MIMTKLIWPPKKLEIQSVEIHAVKTFSWEHVAFENFKTQALKEITIAWQLDAFNSICIVYQVEI